MHGVTMKINKSILEFEFALEVSSNRLLMMVMEPQLFAAEG